MNLNLSPPEPLAPSMVANDEPAAVLSAAAQVVKRRWNDAHSRFDIYRAEHVRLSSTLFGGGDWHWRLTGASGAVIADCGGYRNEAQCLAAVGALRIEAGLATIFREAAPELLPRTIF